MLLTIAQVSEPRFLRVQGRAEFVRLPEPGRSVQSRPPLTGYSGSAWLHLRYAPGDPEAGRSSAAKRASISSSSIALAVWSRMLSAARTLVAGGVLGSTMALPKVVTAAL